MPVVDFQVGAVLTAADLDASFAACVLTDTARTITAQHSFSPAGAQAPFVLGANAQGQLVAGLNADQLDSQGGAHYLALANAMGTLAAANGGTGLASYAAGDILYASGSTTLARLAAGSNGDVLTLAAGAPSWAAADDHTHPGGDITSAVAQATNAGTLDSLNSSQFARSDVNDAIGGTYTFAAGAQIKTDVGILSDTDTIVLNRPGTGERNRIAFSSAGNRRFGLGLGNSNTALDLDFGFLPRFTFGSGGDADAFGTWNDNTLDLAEEYDLAEPAGAGTVLTVDPEHDNRLCRTTGAYQVIAGVVSYHDAQLKDTGLAPGRHDILGLHEYKNPHPVGLVGLVAVKVTDEGGPVRRGDVLVSASEPGHAMKGDPARIQHARQIVGIALARHAEGTGIINAQR